MTYFNGEIWEWMIWLWLKNSHRFFFFLTWFLLINNDRFLNHFQNEVSMISEACISLTQLFCSSFFSFIFIFISFVHFLKRILVISRHDFCFYLFIYVFFIQFFISLYFALFIFFVWSFAIVSLYGIVGYTKVLLH